MKKWPTPRAGNPGSRKPGTGGGGFGRGSETAGLRELSLFSGSGGGLLGSMLLGWHLTAAVEWDAYCQRVLSARFPDVPCHSDVRDFHPVPDSCDIVTGGFPCQPFSQAGKRLGEDDPRNMWPHAVRVLRESGAPLGFFENVPGLLSSGYFGTVLGDLAEAGFDAEWCVLGADDVGAPHRRKRLWILAYSASHLRRASGDDGRVAPDGAGDRGAGSPWRFDPADVGDGFGAGLEERQGESGDDGAQQSAAERTGGAQRVEAWLTLTGLGGTSHGLAASLDRISGS